MLLRNVIEGKKGVFYGRHSTDKQEMEMQWNTASQIIQKYNGTLLRKDYRDPNVSATKVPMIKRKHLQRLLEDAEKRTFDFVVTYSRDRLARDAYEHQTIRETMNDLNIPIVLASTETLYDSGDVVIELMQDGLSQYEVEQTRSRTRDTMVMRIERGDWVGRKPPYGYRFDKEKRIIEQVPGEIENARKVFDRYLKGEGFHLIAKNLGEPWTKEKVKSIITNPFYAGYLTAFKGKKRAHNSINDRSEWVMSDKLDFIPDIVTLEEWERCWYLYDQCRKRKVSPRFYNHNFLLTGLVRCGVCNKPLTPINKTNKSSKNEKWRRYMCACKRDNPECFEADTFEKSIVQNVFDKVQSLSLVPGGMERVLDDVRQSIEKDIGNTRKQIKEFKKEMDTLQLRIQEADQEMHALYKNRKDNEKMLFILQNYRLQKQTLVNQLEQKIKDLDVQLNFKEEVDVKSVPWDTLYANALTGERQSLRHFLIFLIQEIVVDAKGNVTNFHARVDLNFSI